MNFNDVISWAASWIVDALADEGEVYDAENVSMSTFNKGR